MTYTPMKAMKQSVRHLLPDTNAAPPPDLDPLSQQLLIDPLGVHNAVEKELSERSLSYFIKSNWQTIDPSPYKHNWHIDAICEHLQAVTDGHIRRLVINMPPRCMKSIGLAVAWPAWSWIRRPELRFLFASYAQTLSTRDAVKARRLILSAKFQSYWGDRFKLTSDQNAKQRYDNNKGGYRLATSVDGALTGEGGDIIGIDDPHNVKEGESDTVRQAACTWWDESMSTRLNDPKTGAYVIQQQRVHESDLTGHVLDKKKVEALEAPDWVHLNLPMEYEKKNRCIVEVTGWGDPRKEEGELLWPDRFGPTEVATLKSDLGEYGTANQLQQRPAPREGGMFKTGKILIVPNIPGQILQLVRYWDKAGTDAIKNPNAAFTAGCKMAKLSTGQFIILHMHRGQWDTYKRETEIKNIAQQDGIECEQWVEQEPGSGGKESAQNTVQNLAGLVVRADRPTGNKELRADPFSSQVNGSNVLMIRGPWNKACIHELKTFPNSKFKDQVDACSGAFSKINSGLRAGTW